MVGTTVLLAQLLPVIGLLLETIANAVSQSGDEPLAQKFSKAYKKTWKSAQEKEMSLERLKTTWSELREFLLEDEEYAGYIAKMDAYLSLL